METFVVRVWTPAQRQAVAVSPALRGEVEHAATGVAATFVGAEQLLAFLARALDGNPDGRPLPVGPDVLRIAPDIVLDEPGRQPSGDSHLDG